MQSITRFLALTALSGMLAACGGGGASVPETTTENAAVISSSVPQRLLSRVTYRTPIGESGAEEGKLLIASDKENKLLLAAVNTGAGTELSSASTAKALARIATGYADGLDSVALTRLEAAIQSAAEQGLAPLESSAVVTALSVVEKPEQVQTKAIAQPRLDADCRAAALLPPTGLGCFSGLHGGTVWIEAPTFLPINIRNDGFLTWQVSTFDGDNLPLSQAQLTARKRGVLEGPASLKVEVSPARTFSLLVSQNKETSQAALVSILSNALQNLYGLIPYSQYLPVNPDEADKIVTRLVNDPRYGLRDAFRAFLELPPQTVMNFTIPSTTQQMMIDRTKIVVEGVWDALTQNVTGTLYLGKQLAEWHQFKDSPPATLGICVSDVGRVVNCPARLVFAQAQRQLNLGQTFNAALNLKAMVSGSGSTTDRETWVPPVLYSIEGPTGVATVDRNSGLVTAVAAGTATLRATDPATDATGTMTLVVAPRLEMLPVWSHFTLPYAASATQNSFGCLRGGVDANLVMTYELASTGTGCGSVSAWSSSMRAGYTWGQRNNFDAMLHDAAGRPGPEQGAYVSEVWRPSSGNILIDTKKRLSEVFMVLDGLSCTANQKAYTVRGGENTVSLIPSDPTGTVLSIDLNSFLGIQEIYVNKNGQKDLRIAFSSTTGVFLTVQVADNAATGANSWIFVYGPAGNPVPPQFLCGQGRGVTMGLF